MHRRLKKIPKIVSKLIKVEVCRTIVTIPYDTGLEAPFAHSLHTVYFRKFTPCLLPRLIFEPEPLRQVGKFRPTKLN